MTADTIIEDAVSQLEMLGIDRKKAIKALNRYNNDVERAADYIFSGNADSDSDDANEYPWANISSFENVYSSDQEQQQQQQKQQMDVSLDTIDDDLKATFGEERQANLTKDYEKLGSQSNNQSISHVSTSWSVVPYVEKPAKEEEVQVQENEVPIQGLTKANLTWWADPENPSERAAIHNNPIGLRPPSYNFAYSPIIIQALFHVSLFRFAILSFRPLPYNWGATRNYWKGFGESVSGYIIKDGKLDELTTQINNSVIDDDDDDDDDDNFQNNNINQMEIDQQSVSTETYDLNNNLGLENQQQKKTNYINNNNNETELITMTKDHLVLAELQKLFGYLSCSNRMYGSVSHFIRVFNSDIIASSNSWKMEDKNVDEFLDVFFRQLIATDQVNDFIKNNDKFKGLLSFHDLFRLQAEVCSGDDVDIEEVYYLNLSIDATGKSFYDCLDPLVFESYQDDSTLLDNPEDEILSNPSDDGINQVLPYKITTFTQVPPLLFITLEDRRDYNTKNSVNNKKTYTVDKTIYLDRYLNVNKSISVQKYQQADELRKQIYKTQHELQKIQNNENHDLNKHQLLDSTITYFNNKIETVENISANNEYMESLKSLQSILHQVQSNIEKKQSELKQLKDEQSQKLREIFNDADLQKKPFDIRAVLYTDGLSGTGHYWGYIWVEPNERNLLIDIEVNDGGWYRFCDADVQCVSEDDLWKEDTNPFALLYVDRSIPCLTKEELDKYIPEELKNIIHHDNDTFIKEIQDYKHNINKNKTMNHPPFASLYKSNQNIGSINEANKGIINEKHGEIYKNGSYDNIKDSVFDEQTNEEEVVYDGFKSPKQMNSINDEDEDEEDYDDDYDEDEDIKHSNENLSIDSPSMDNEVYDSLSLDVAAEKIIEARSFTNSGNKILERFDIFLAVAGDVSTLANYIKIVDTQIQRIPPKNNNDDGHNINDIINIDHLNFKLASITISEIRQLIKDDRQLSELLDLYLQYLSMAEIITNALLLFNKDNYNDAIKQIIMLKQLNETWRTELLLNDTLMTKYQGLDSIGFNRIATYLGKTIIKILNKQAYNKACHESYQERGFVDGIKVANQAYQIIGNEVGEERTHFFTEISECWLNFAEQQQNGQLLQHQEDLLNNLVMIYFDGPSTHMNATNQLTTDNSHYPKINEDESQTSLSNQFSVNLQLAENKLNV